MIVNILLFLVFGTLAGTPEENKYKVSDIPEELRKDVNVVIREDISEFKIFSKTKATRKVVFVATILNPKAKDFAQMVIGYDKLRKITSFKGAVYAADGNLIKKLKNGEIYDQSVFDGFSLYSDSRLKSADLSQGVYPYTVEFEYEMTHENLFQIPGFEVLPNSESSVVHGKFSLIAPKELMPRYKSFNIDAKPTVATMNGSESVSWEFSHVLPIKSEPFGPGPERTRPFILVGPKAFDFDGYEGTMENWNQFGQWILKLNKDRDNLPEATRVKIVQLTSGLASDEEKIAAVYNFLQQKTRYVSIQLGIGGFQPFDATVVDQTGYGDCKALSNYTVALLKAAGVKAHYVLIDAGDDYSFHPDFVSSQFNHAIVAVPGKTDTLWLECTSQTNPFGYMGTFTGDRKALLITDNGAEVVNTLSYPAEKNLQTRVSEVSLQANGDAVAKVKTVYAGLQYENGGVDRLLSGQFDEQKKWIQNNTDIPSFDVVNFRFSAEKKKIPSATVEAELKMARFATVSGKRLLFTPNLMNKSTFVPPKLEARKHPVVKRTAFIDVDTIRYHVPDNLYPEFLPQPTKLTSRFGEYEMKVTLDEKGIIYVRKLKMLKGEFPVESYQELIDFYKQINKADNMKLVFLNKT
jgi:hypothetical protein